MEDFFALLPHFCLAQGFESVKGFKIVQNTWVETVLITGLSEEDKPWKSLGLIHVPKALRVQQGAI